MKISEVLTARQAAASVGVCRQTIYEWMKSGFLPWTQVGHVRFIRKADLARAAEEKTKRDKSGNYERGVSPK